MNLSILSDDDLQNLIDKKLENLSDTGLKYLTNEEFSPGEVVARSSERGATANQRGTAELLGKAAPVQEAAPGYEDRYEDPLSFMSDTPFKKPPKPFLIKEKNVATPGYEDPLSWMGGTPLSPEAERSSIATPEEKQKTDLEREYEFRVMQEQSPWWAGAGYLSTAIIADPLNLIGIGLAKNAWKAAGVFGTLGAASAGLEPTYEEWDDSRLRNMAYGAGFGAVLGGGATKLVNALEARAAKKSAAVEVDDTAKALTEEEKILAAEGEEFANEFRVNQDPTADSIAQTNKALVNTYDSANLPILPSRLSGAKPKYGTVDMEFETDIDKAFYIIGNPKSKSAKHDEYVDYLSKALGVPETEVIKMAREARTDILNQAKANNDAFAMMGKQAKSYKINMSSALDNLVNPVTKGLDTNSLYLYNMGKKFTPTQTGTYKAAPADVASESFKKFTEQMRRVDPSVTPGKAVQAMRGYADMLDGLKKAEGRNYVSRSFDEFIKNKPYNLDERIVMANQGKYDGCL
jgi:hypothetical protein